MVRNKSAPDQGRVQATDWIKLGLCLVGVIIVVAGINWLKSWYTITLTGGLPGL